MEWPLDNCKTSVNSKLMLRKGVISMSDLDFTDAIQLSINSLYTLRRASSFVTAVSNAAITITSKSQ